MPVLELTTNVKLGAETLKKPELYITVKYIYNETLTFQGTLDPAFTMNIISLGNLNETANEAYSRAFFDFFKERLGVQGDRGYM
ncbi:hypothetical protein C0995_013657 [Termitomyces sp. Mi166|nr:hypothetical protein C0995_013657 [Termitomyces sp. Mi166\